MKWSLKLGTYAGIGVYMHWTFGLLIGWSFLAHLRAGESVPEALAGVGFMLALFACVVLHEFGHALTARRFGVRTRDITLLPIGGVARLERIPEKPMQEFWVAVAGPAVNVVIAAMLFFVIFALHGANQLLEVQWLRGRFLIQLMWVNLFLVAFNLLPAFPMDGGRVLRALLATRMDRRRATAVAARVGQFMAVLFGIFGFFYNPFLILIAVFVFLGAQAEATQVEVQSALQGRRVRDAMITRFQVLSPRDTLEKAAEELLAGSQQDFPVAENGSVVGLLRRNDLVNALSAGNRDGLVGAAMFRECQPVNEADDLAPVLEKMRANQCSALPVVAEGKLTGLLTIENARELLMINSALTARNGASPLRSPALSGEIVPPPPSANPGSKSLL